MRPNEDEHDGQRSQDSQIEPTLSEAEEVRAKMWIKSTFYIHWNAYSFYFILITPSYYLLNFFLFCEE